MLLVLVVHYLYFIHNKILIVSVRGCIILIELNMVNILLSFSILRKTGMGAYWM